MGELVGEAVGRQIARLAEQHVAEREAERLRVYRLGLLPPGLERLAAVYPVRHPRLEEAGHRVVVREHVALPRFVAQPPDLLEDGAVVIHERGLRRQLLPHERVQDEHPARRFGVDGPVVDLAIAHDRQPVQAHLLRHHHLRRPLGPARIPVAPLAERPARRLQPRRVDLRRRPREEPRCLHQLRRDHPLRRLLRQARRGVEREARLPRAHVHALLGVPRPHAAEQPGEQRPVHRLVPRGLLVDRAPHLAGDPRELPVHVDPLAHPHVRQEAVAAEPAELVLREAALRLRKWCQILSRLAKSEASSRKRRCASSACFCAASGRSRGSWIAERRRDDQHLAQRALLLAPEDHPADARVDGQPRELLADVGELAVAVERADLLELAVALVHRALRRRDRGRGSPRCRRGRAPSSGGWRPRGRRGGSRDRCTPGGARTPAPRRGGSRRRSGCAPRGLCAGRRWRARWARRGARSRPMRGSCRLRRATPESTT